MLLSHAALLVLFTLGVNSFDLKVDEVEKTDKSQVNSDQDVLESGYRSNTKEEYGRNEKYYDYKNMPNDKELAAYSKDMSDRDREIEYSRDAPYDREREIEYPKDIPNDKEKENAYFRDVPYDKERGVTYRNLMEKNYRGNYNDKGLNDKLEYQMDYDKPFDKKTIKKLDEIFGFTGPTANDEPENLIRPCSLDDWQCIRKYFESNSQCKASYGPIPDPFYIEKHTFFFSAANVTANFINFSIRGLSSAKLIDFYVNKKSGNLVFAIDVQNLNITVPRAYVRFRRTAKESIVVADSAFVIFRSAIFTAVISKVPKLRLDDSDIHVFVNDATPVFNYGPAFFVNPDPDILAANAEFIALLPVAIREGLVFLAPLITGIYIQENICKFDTKLISL